MMRANVWTGKWPQRAHELVMSLGSVRDAAKIVAEEMGRPISDGSLRGMLRCQFPDWQKTMAHREPGAATDPASVLRDRVKTLEVQLEEAQRSALTDERVAREILRLQASAAGVREPEWMLRSRKNPSAPGVPTLFASDWHWGETVDPNQIGGVNKYDLAIARKRARACIENAIDLILRHTVGGPGVPGVVLALGGDMISGDIHEELSATNEREWAPTLLDLQGVMVWAVKTLAKELGRVFVVAVTGNHARTTHKPRAKGRNFTNFDWLLYQQLRLRFEDEKPVQMFVPDGSDALYSVLGHRYLLTHGDQYRGGDGIIGSIGPVFRGDTRKRARNSAIGQGYDTALVAHFHEYRAERRRIQNGSLVGYNEYAHSKNFAVEPPQQALWWTHGEYGPTIHMPVFVERQASKAGASWVQWAA